MKKLVSLLLLVSLLCASLLFTGCPAEKPIVGIMQFGTHASLNNCHAGILAALADAGITEENYEIVTLNSNFSGETAQTQAKTLVNRGASVIVAIATPSAIAAATAAVSKSVPVVYCAVTDPTTVANFENVTGTSDVPDFTAQLSLVCGFFDRENVKIGVLMSSDESSDPAQLLALQAAAASHTGMEIVSETVSDITTVTAKTDLLIEANCDCLVNLLDNTIVGKLQNILARTNDAGIPVFGSEVEQVKEGCLASASIEYVTVGRLAGEQAAAILNGTPIASVSPRTMENETFPVYNSDVLAAFPTLNLPNINGLTDVLEGN